MVFSTTSFVSRVDLFTKQLNGMYIIAPSPKLTARPSKQVFFAPKLKRIVFQTNHFCRCILVVEFLRSISDVSVSKFSSRLRGFIGLATHIGGGKKKSFQIVFYLHPEPWGR